MPSPLPCTSVGCPNLPTTPGVFYDTKDHDYTEVRYCASCAAMHGSQFTPNGGLPPSDPGADAVFDFLNWLVPQNIQLTSHGDPWKGEPILTHHKPGELFEKWKEQR